MVKKEWSRHGIPVAQKVAGAGKPPLFERPGKSEDKISKAKFWRVIAPFVRVPKKVDHKRAEKIDKQFSFYLQKKPAVLLQDLSSFMSDNVALPCLFQETAEVLKNVTKASWACLYFVDKPNNEIYLSTTQLVKRRHRISWEINDESTVAAYVAMHKEYIIIDDILKDMRFPEGIGNYGSAKPKSVMCLPVMTPEDDCIVVIEFVRLSSLPPFENDDLKICIMVAAWMGIAFHQNQQRLAIKRQQELNDYLLDLIKCYFEDNVQMDKLMIEVLKFAKVTLGAERGSFFIMDDDSEEMVAHVFEDEPNNEGNRPKRVRFSKESGIASLVVKTKQTINVKDAYTDPRFNKEVEQKTGFITRSILCMPILGAKGVMGVVQVVNKTNEGCFTTADEDLFKTFSLYCSLAMHYTKVHSEINNQMYLDTLLKRALRLQQVPCLHDIRFYIESKKIPEVPNDFDSWYVRNKDELLLAPFFTMYMLVKLINPREINKKIMMKFILTVRKSYRDLPYHNFEHAFNVCHCMYMILRRNRNQFTKLEIKSLLIACLCHDLDHSGLSSSFLQSTHDDLAMLYKDALLERHHCFVALQLLAEHEIFRGLSKEETKLFYDQIRMCIMSTEITTFFGNYSKLSKLQSTSSLSWENIEHKRLVKSLMMNVCDLSGNCKPFLSAKRLVDNLYKEFYYQGDLEKQLGYCVLPGMDREAMDMVPEQQILFQNVIVIPCMQMLKSIMPTTNDLYLGAIVLRSKWRAILETRGNKMWRQDDSIVK